MVFHTALQGSEVEKHRVHTSDGLRDNAGTLATTGCTPESGTEDGFILLDLKVFRRGVYKSFGTWLQDLNLSGILYLV